MECAAQLRGFEGLPGDSLSNCDVDFCSSDISLPLINAINDKLVKMHEAGYVHGDVRDANIMVSKNDEDEACFMLINFSGAGKIGEARYRYRIPSEEDDVWRPDGAVLEHSWPLGMTSTCCKR
ncbi:hypothetical protein BJ138DRAFT_1103866 [Hygrophoropsis aurantiaca]|uniref:Uncharacterized protein n=1 Tax=Hygrophoropsis aurantiaca TaxID=72124 RepID=A0ACB8A467_9AGAM|nr:hypothetical protein BJ138DRAFT_1103866 [Hygrophoropsis aurantiaca]